VKLNDSASEKERDTAQWNQRMTVLGTVAYMAPELVNAEKHYTEAIDVYAMGITFWEIWTGKDPFAKENTFSLYQLIVQGARPDIPPDCPERLEEIIKDCWATTADHRPSAFTVAQKMEDILDFHATLPHTGDNKKPIHILTNNEKLIPYGSDVKFKTTHFSEIRDGNNADTSFQYADTYGAGDTTSATDQQVSYVNPLKRLIRKSFKKK
jgi:serine/threonine protein kinase